jgi:hypothetical protein
MREFIEQLSFIGLIDPHIVHRLIAQMGFSLNSHEDFNWIEIKSA